MARTAAQSGITCQQLSHWPQNRDLDVGHQARAAGGTYDEAGECKVPVGLEWTLKQVSADSLQSPHHDPDVTYSGHKVARGTRCRWRRCHEENATQLITHVDDPLEWERHRACRSLTGSAEGPPDKKLFADTAYGSGSNAFEASRRRTSWETGELRWRESAGLPGNSATPGEKESGWRGPPAAHQDRDYSASTSQGSRPLVLPRRPPVHRGVRAEGCWSGAGRGPLYRDNNSASPARKISGCPVKLDRSVRGPTGGSRRTWAKVTPSSGPEGRGPPRKLAQAVLTKGWYRGTELPGLKRRYRTGFQLAGEEGAVGCGLPST